jgi:hypothetical protein
MSFYITKCKGPHHDLDDFTTYDLTTFTTSRLVSESDLETGFTVQKCVSRSIKSRESREAVSREVVDVVMLMYVVLCTLSYHKL